MWPVVVRYAPPAPEPRPLTLGAALDFVFEQLKTGDDAVMPRIEREMITRALAADGGDEAKAAKRLGVTKAALQKKAKE